MRNKLNALSKQKNSPTDRASFIPYCLITVMTVASADVVHILIKTHENVSDTYVSPQNGCVFMAGGHRYLTP